MIIWAIPGRGGAPLVFSDKNNSGSIDNSEIISETHYYPFGKAFDGAWYGDSNASKYRYLYNGKELSEEFDLNFYDYGARWLDPGIGSWWEVDPASEGNRRWSPYAYGNNNPVRFIDPDGMSAFELTGSNGYGVTGAETDNSTERDILNRNDVIAKCETCPKNKTYDIYRDSDALFTYDNKTGIVVNGDGKGATVYGKRESQATTIGLPWWYSLGAFTENIPQISLNSLKVAATIPLMTLAFVLTPTQAQAPGVNPEIRYYESPPTVLPGFPGARKVIPKAGRARWVTPDGDILEWDSQHGEIEVYDKRGKHKRVADPNSGETIKPKVPGRTTPN
ncbi:colicin E3/pyocin S6 family cytotoxin [Dyadobacter tibetensis]|uniref:colicin E3/pyocin S6 family cytotoxin n=1 Tax=Dyadobacter tibetensis TaxID=1211851 RepID=UPI0018DE9F52|nr:colicin E3/pyocin S6 family cytotoxin [Dyadobacter tibetensis]